MPISANATITVRTVAETIAIALTFIIGNRCCERTIVAHGNQEYVGIPSYIFLSFLVKYICR